MKKSICLLICLFFGLITLCGCKKDNTPEQSYSKYFENNSGCAVFFKNNEYYICNNEMANIQKSPCSTFKIVLTLAGLKYGVLQNENTVIKWDGEKRYFDEWNKDLSLKEAFNLSAVWYFEKVANEIGKEKLAEFVNKISYGNKNTSAEIPFWLDSSLKISPKEQVNFLKNLFEYKLDIDNQHIETLKEIMRKDIINGGILYGKTGTSGDGNNGWFVGFYEKDNEKTYFAINLSAGENVSGKQAEKTTKNIITDYF
ncbi:MAG: penicillin-binding transpeptidase domain-containing protein [Clostridia bacterium]|nr:penicillin-binding transpeptidase domain-containing protein [Clostridia bacterium]